MHTYCCYKEELPIELCKGLVNIGRELNKEEAKVFKEGDDIKMQEVRNNKIAWLENPGSIAVFPSFMFHRVTKVKEGERSSLVCWFRGEKFT